MGLVIIGAAVAWIAWLQLPGIGAGALLHPAKRAVTQPPPAGCVSRDFRSAGLTLRGWMCEPAAVTRGTIVYLHGVADNRQSATGVIARYLPRGYRVVAYDSRAHGESDGAACTYGFYEKGDLRRVIDALPPGPVALIGTSLGAAVSLQEAADDPRIITIVAAETFADLRTVATGRAPLFFTRGTIARAFRLAEHDAGFEVDEVSAVRAAIRITVPVLLIHGDADIDTPAAHPTPNTQHPTPNTQHPTPNTQHPTPNTQHPTPNTQHPTLCVRIQRSRNTSRGNANLDATESMTLIWQV